VATKEINQTRDLVEATEQQGVEKVLKSQFHELMSMAPSVERNVCRVFRDFLLSNLGLSYFSKLNLLAKKELIANTKESRDNISRWIDSDVMGAIDALCEAGVFEDPKALLALSDIAIALYSSLSVIDEDDIEQDMGYLFDLPYQLNEMAKESPRIPSFYTHTHLFKPEEEAWAKQVSLHVSDTKMKLSYEISVKDER